MNEVPEQEPVDDRVLVALLEARADVAVVPRDPGRPLGLELRLGEAGELRRQRAGKLDENRPHFGEPDVSSRSDRGDGCSRLR